MLARIIHEIDFLKACRIGDRARWSQWLGCAHSFPFPLGAVLQCGVRRSVEKIDRREISPGEPTIDAREEAAEPKLDGGLRAE